MKGFLANRRAALRQASPDVGMTMWELLTVIVISSVVLSMVFTAVAAFARNDAKNLVRQERVDDVRQVSLWLSEALAFADADLPASPTDPPQPVFAEAMAQKMVFTSALVENQGAGDLPLSRVTVILGQDCVGNVDEGVLHRCIQHPFEDDNGNPKFCTPTDATCPDGKREDFIMARNVNDEPLFTYYLQSNLEVGGGMHAVTDPVQRGQIRAVEFKVTVSGPEDGRTTESTVFKRYAINRWEDL
ncbi:MAG: hypothetical protein LBJ62_04090 [Bifidobacteriaceae bacterium]|jgi:hypothetical protein|nr:hypothetical protein [Bifidobacteriaceae bacterium]